MPVIEPFFKAHKGDLGITKYTKPYLERLHPEAMPEERFVPNVIYFAGRDGFYAFNGKEAKRL
jgi:hypothetical protein